MLEKSGPVGEAPGERPDCAARPLKVEINAQSLDMRNLSRPPAPHFNTPLLRVFSLRRTSSMDWKGTGGNRAANSFSALSA